MPRTAREKSSYGVFYVHQKSNPKGVLFRDDADRKNFLDVIIKAQKKFGFMLYGYCLLASDEYHLILDVNGGDLSNIMKSINIRYAMYAKSELPLFKDRYKSQHLKNIRDINQRILEINKSGSSEFNSYCHYDKSSPIDLKWIAPIQEEAENDITQCKVCLEKLEDAECYLISLAKEGGMTVEELLCDKSCRNETMKHIRQKSTLSLKEIGILFGGLSESAVSKILNK